MPSTILSAFAKLPLVSRDRLLRLLFGCSCLLLGTTPVVSGQAIIWQASGVGANAAASVGDLDGDGVRDVIVGNRYIGSNSGQVVVHSGASGTVLFSFTGSPGDYFGSCVTGLGDLDNDSVPDFAAGANGFGSGTCVGYVKVYSGMTGAVLHTLTGGTCFGWSLANAGDVNFDGVDDIAVGDGGGGGLGQFGKVCVFSGASGGLIRTVNGDPAHPNGQFGGTLASAGDMDGDGVPDLIVGARESGFGNGYAQVISGMTGTVHLTVTGPSFDSRFGCDVDRTGDIDGDGIDDFIVGAFKSNSFTGQATVFSGSNGTPIHTFAGSTTSDQLGSSVAGAGDFDGDGTLDVIAGAPQMGPMCGGGGYVRIISGSGIGGSTFFTLNPSGTCSFGSAVAGAGDLNGDGLSDIIVTDATSVYAFSFVEDCLTGTVGASAGGPFDVLTVNGSSGGASRTETIYIGGPITIAVAQPPFNPIPASFVVFGALGFPMPNDIYATSFGSLCFAPSPVYPSFPGLFTLANSFSGFSVNPPELVPATPAPWSFSMPQGIGFPAQFTLQGVIDDNAPATSNLAVTNGIRVDVVPIPVPIISSVSPLVGMPGATVTITGTGFLPGLTLTVAGASVPVSVSPTIITFALPTGVSCDTPLVVTNPGGTSASALLNPTPVIISSLYASGMAAGGALFALIGTGFVAGSTVTIGGALASVSVITPTAIAMTTPPGSIGAAVVIVTSPGGCSAMTTYTFM